MVRRGQPVGPSGFRGRLGPMAGFCPTCGAARPDDAAFCAKCGSRFDPLPAQKVGWGLENPAGFRPMVVNPLVLWLLVVGGLVLGLLFAVYVLGNLLSGLALLGGLIACPIIGAALGSWAATNLLR